MANSKGIKSLKLVGKPGGIVQPGITKYGVWDWVETAIDYGKKGYEWYKENKDLADTIAKTATSLGKGYLDYKDAKRRNELEERAYEDYMKEAEAAGYEAQAAIDLNLTPMTITNIPTTKADITDYTAATGLKHGGISGLRKKYAEGMDEFEVEEMDEEVITPEYLMKEEGVEIGPMASGKYSQEEIEAYEQYKYDMNEQKPGFPIMEIDEFLRFWYSTAKGRMKDMRKTYSMGTPDTDVEIMDEEFVGDNELKMEEGVQIGPMAGGGERGWKAQMLAEEIAEEQYGKEFYDLSQDLQMKVYQIALDMIDDQAKAPGEDLKGIMMAAKGGRIKKANGGIMDLGGLEKDYRFSGGFVPIGEYEKKDDVPARLSKNEFVFTADAVRAAGGGSINKGAKRMYNVMKNLEAKPEAKRMTA